MFPTTKNDVLTQDHAATEATPAKDEDALLTRRQVLKLTAVAGLSGSAALLFWGWPLGDRGRERVPKALHAWHVLNGERAEIILALAPIFLRGAWPEDHAAQPNLARKLLHYVDLSLARASVQDVENIERLLALMSSAPFRRWLAWVRQPWLLADETALQAFLSRWQFSRLAHFRAAYQDLRNLILQAWYSDEASWERLSFSGLPMRSIPRKIRRKPNLSPFKNSK